MGRDLEDFGRVELVLGEREAAEADRAAVGQHRLAQEFLVPLAAQQGEVAADERLRLDPLPPVREGRFTPRDGGAGENFVGRQVDRRPELAGPR